MRKRDRHQLIKKMITEEKLSTQKEIQDRLEAHNVCVTQTPNFKLKLATQKKFTWRLVVQAFFRVVVNPIFDKSYFFRSRFLGSFR